MRIEFTSQAQQLENSLNLLNTSIDLYKNSIEDKAKLLEIAKVAFSTDRMSIEDYLKYEDDLILEKSKLYKTQANKWQMLMKLAVIYGNNIEYKTSLFQSSYFLVDTNAIDAKLV